MWWTTTISQHILLLRHIIDTPTCLIVAAQHGHTETVRYLVGLNNVNHRDYRGETALHHARQKQHTDVVQVLLKHGAEE